MQRSPNFNVPRVSNSENKIKITLISHKRKNDELFIDEVNIRN